ncbi:MAG: branched-chain amino acid transport system substrate-binding protein [Acetobacteraceae bacterium]|nr:braC 5 [Rhodopila sp.]MEA2731765.1 branched-chain amino acid transport system substrate-binding protein [Acetobacteraceae bacterium]
MNRRNLLAAAAMLPVAAIFRPRRAAAAAISDGVVKIGVLDDMSGVFSDQQGYGDFVAARMAAEDFGGNVLGAPIEVIQADLQNKVDVGLSTARHWIDEDKVDAIFGLGNSAVALAVQDLCKQRERIDVPIAAGTTDLTGSACSPYGVHWTYDNYSAAKGPAEALVKQGQKKWFFITSDYAFGKSLELNATAILRGLGATVLGHSLAPLGETDFSAHLLAAASSGAQAVGIAAGGADFINIAKQMGEFGLTRRGIVPAALNCSLTNIHSLGLAAAQGMIFSQPYYWDHDEPSRAFAARFAKQHKDRPPTAFQASTWGAVTHYLKAIQAAGTDAAGPVMEKMREIPINDFMTKDGKLRIDGRVVRDTFLLRAKQPAQSKSEWDLLEVVETIAGVDAFRPMSEGGCPLVKA